MTWSFRVLYAGGKRWRGQGFGALHCNCNKIPPFLSALHSEVSILKRCLVLTTGPWTLSFPLLLTLCWFHQAHSPASFTSSLCFPRFVALHAYSAHGPDELDLQKGEGVRVLGKYQDGWLRGVSLVTGRVGIFPNNYVIPILRCVLSNLRNQRVGSSRPESISEWNG